MLGGFPLCEAGAVERIGSFVADSPILVVVLRDIDGDGIAPVDAVGGAADDDIADGVDEGETGDQPDAVFGVVGDGGIGCAIVASTLVVDGEVGEVAVDAGLAAVAGSGETDAGAAPSDGAGTAGDVVGGHDGGAPSKGIGLDFGAVVAIGVGEFVHADLLQSELSVGGQSERGDDDDSYTKIAMGGKHLDDLDLGFRPRSAGSGAGRADSRHGEYYRE